MTATTKHKCGCRSTDEPSRWVELCAEHEAERGARFAESQLDSMEWLIQHYAKFPNEDNLRHVIDRLRALGAAVNKRPSLVQLIAAHRPAILAAAKKLHG